MIETKLMRFVRPVDRWCILQTTPKSRACLQVLALKCGYRICEMCMELGCTERYFYEAFARDLGLTPKEWLKRERMVVARRMLTGGRTPDEVASCLGFSSANNFRREFLMHYQVPPLRFQAEQWGQRWRTD